MPGHRAIVFAVLATVLVLIAGGGAAAWALWPDGSTASPVAAPSPAATTADIADVIDGDARTMCFHIAQARILHDSDEPNAPGYGGSVADMEELTATTKAKTAAIKSESPEIAAILGPDLDTSIPPLAAWCRDKALIE